VVVVVLGDKKDHICISDIKLIPATKYNKNFYQKNDDQWTHQESRNKAI